MASQVIGASESSGIVGSFSAVSRRRKAFVRVLRTPTGFIGLSVPVVMVVLALLAPLIAPYGPTEMSQFLSAPTSAHWLGTDDLGRDTLSRLLYGARTSLAVALGSMLVATVVGTFLGLIAGFFGGALDSILMRALDTLLALPAILLALVLVSALGASAVNAAIAIAIIYTPYFARIIRANTLSLKEWPFVEASRALGASNQRLLFRSILPNCLSPLLVQISLGVSYAILVEAGLSFLGLGVRPPTPSWGSMLLSGRNLMAIAPWGVVFPGLFICVTAMGFNFLGDALQELSNPVKGR